MSLLDNAPSPGSYCAEPFTAPEIDAHADCDRLWATVMSLADVDLDAVNVAVGRAVAEIGLRLDAEIDRVISIYFNGKDPCENATLRIAIRCLADEVYA